MPRSNTKQAGVPEMSPEVYAAIAAQREAFRKKFWREPGPGDEVARGGGQILRTVCLLADLACCLEDQWPSSVDIVSSKPGQSPPTRTELAARVVDK